MAKNTYYIIKLLFRRTDLLKSKQREGDRSTLANIKPHARCGFILVRAERVELSSFVWKTNILTAILCPLTWYIIPGVAYLKKDYSALSASSFVT